MINTALKNTAAMAMGTNGHTVVSNSIIDELIWHVRNQPKRGNVEGEMAANLTCLSER